MYIARLSLFCAAAWLINGAYAKDLADSTGANARIAELTVAPQQVRDYRVGAMQDKTGELRQPDALDAGNDAQWVRIADQGKTTTAKREPRPADKTLRWVF